MLFDLDGVLVDSRVPIARSLNHALACHGLGPLPENSLHGFIGDPLEQVFRALLERLGGHLESLGSCVEAYREHYRDASLAGTRAFEGIHELLVRLGRRVPLVVATSKPAPAAEPILENLGLLGRFRAVVGPSLERDGESKTETVARALAALGRAGLGVAMVGDRHHDVRAGRAHGLTTVGVTWGIGDSAELRAAGVQHLVDTPEDLLSLLEWL